jgi:murein DD-endopeptidase MepM/ murein hydrolase activator NlpD
MLTRSKRACLALVLLAVVLVPAAGSHADDPDRLKAKKAQLSDVRDRIDALATERGDIKQQIIEIDRTIRELQIDLRRLEAEAAKLESEVRSTQAEIDATQAQIDKIRGRATEQAIELYKSGATDAIDALLDSRSLSELDDRIQYIGVASQQNTGALIRFGRLRLQIEKQNRELLQEKAALDAVLEEKSAVLAAEQKASSVLAQKFVDLGDKLEHAKDMEGDLSSSVEQITADILAAQAKSAVVSLGESAKGFIWPLNGRVTSGYGPRWGRMHTGIDIDGVSGQPIVASKAGRVILSSYYSGYGNAVIVDHGGGVSTLYAHMSRFRVSKGAIVEQGQILGEVGCTGSCTGDHLHFEVRINGDPVDPMPYLP